MEQKLYHQKELSDYEQSLIRLAVQTEIMKLEAILSDASDRVKMPVMSRTLETLKRVSTLFYSHEIAVVNDLGCERCNEFPCVCGTPDFETHNIQQLDAAEDREVL